MAVTEAEFDLFLLGSADADTMARVLAELKIETSQASSWMRKIQSKDIDVADWNKTEEAGKSLFKTEKDVTPHAIVRSTSWKTTLAWAGVSIAAGIVGILIGRLVLPSTSTVGDRELVQAAVELKNAQPRGVGVVAIDLDIQSPRAGFATVIVLSESAETFPLRNEDPISIPAAKFYGPIEAVPGSRLVIVVTETPSRETVRRLAEKMKFKKSTDFAAMQEAISQALWREGYKWAAITESTVPNR